MNQTNDDQQTADSRPLDCDDTLILIDRFAERTLPQEDAQAMRAHLVGCPECTATYRSSVESAARTGAAARDGRERKEEEAARARRVREAVEGQIEPDKRMRNFRLRMLLMPAIFAFLIYQVFKAQDLGPRFVVEGAIGNVEVSGRPMEAYGQNQVILRSSGRCITGPNSSARMVDKDCTVKIGADTEVVVVSVGPSRMRLYLGELEIEGACIIETVLGNVIAGSPESKGRVLLESNGLLVHPQTGTWSFMNASGEELIPLGEHRRFVP